MPSSNTTFLSTDCVLQAVGQAAREPQATRTCHGPYGVKPRPGGELQREDPARHRGWGPEGLRNCPHPQHCFEAHCRQRARLAASCEAFLCVITFALNTGGWALPQERVRNLHQAAARVLSGPAGQRAQAMATVPWGKSGIEVPRRRYKVGAVDSQPPRGHSSTVTRPGDLQVHVPPEVAHIQNPEEHYAHTHPGETCTGPPGGSIWEQGRSQGRGENCLATQPVLGPFQPP